MTDLSYIVEELKRLQKSSNAAPRVRWAIVHSTSPLRIRLEEDAVPVFGKPETIIPASQLRVGDRVEVVLQNNRAIIQGVGGGQGAGIPIGGSFIWTAPAAFIPSGYMEEDGRAISRTVYAELFAMYGTLYGAGNGSTTFNIRDKRGRTSVGVNPADTEFNALGKKFGTKTHTLLHAEMPAHAHQQRFSLVAQSGGNMGGMASSGSGTVYNAEQTTLNTGGSGAHNNVQPSIADFSIVRVI